MCDARHFVLLEARSGHWPASPRATERVRNFGRIGFAVSTYRGSVSRARAELWWDQNNGVRRPTGDPSRTESCQDRSGGRPHYSVCVANLGKLVLVLVAIVGLYALPNIVSDCPEGREWSCTNRLVPDDVDGAAARLVAVTLDGETAAVLMANDEDEIAQLHIWSLESGEIQRTIETSVEIDPTMMFFSADGTTVVLAEKPTDNEELAREIVRVHLDDFTPGDATAADIDRVSEFDDAQAQLVDALDGGELVVATAEGDWYVDIDTTERWTARSARFTASRSDAFIVLRAESEQALPRILRKHPSRIQILDIDEEDVTMDVDLPSEVVDAQWSGDGDQLVAVDTDGVLTIFAREEGA